MCCCPQSGATYQIAAYAEEMLEARAHTPTCGCFIFHLFFVFPSFLLLRTRIKGGRGECHVQYHGCGRGPNVATEFKSPTDYK